MGGAGGEFFPRWRGRRRRTSAHGGGSDGGESREPGAAVSCSVAGAGIACRRVSRASEIRVEDRGPVRVVTVDNPRKRNALDYASLADIEAACAAAARDRVRCLIFRGAGD